MSDDTNPSEPSTRDLVLQLLERIGRIEIAIGLGEADTLPLSGRINRLTAEVAEIKADLAEVKANVATTKVDVAEIKVEMTEVHERLDDIERDVARLSRQDAGRWLRLDDRIRALEHPDETKQ
jgi:chromosome segregation ATPase